MARYGRRGGDGPTAGKKKTRYDVTLPNGDTKRVGSFQIDTEIARAVCYQTNGEWFVSTIIAAVDTPDWVKAGGYGGVPYTLIDVRKV